MITIATAHADSPPAASTFFARGAEVATWHGWNMNTEWVRLDAAFVEGTTAVQAARAPR
jgi:hypothetical protein